MRRMERCASVLLSMAMAASLATTGTNVEAKSASLSKKTISVKVGKTATIKTKNVVKKASVSWKSSNTKVAKITKKSKASCTVKGVKAGSAKLTCAVKVSGKTKKLSCSVTVKASKPIVTTQPTNTPTPQVTATPEPTATASAIPTATPTLEPVATMTPAPTYAAATWNTTWGTAEQKCNLNGAKDAAMPKLALEGTTVRQIVRVTTTGRKIRLRLSNQYGDKDVTIKSLHVAKQVTETKSEIIRETDTIVTVGGKEEFKIPKGQVIMTDEVDFSIRALDNVAISCYFGSTPKQNITGHRGARATTYQMEGNQVSLPEFPRTRETKTTTSWFFLADVSLESPVGAKSVVCFGDSITDGYGTDTMGHKPDSYIRWGDYFAKRLQANEATKNVSVINEGIGSNSIMGAYPTDAGKDRFKRDLLEHDGVAYCIILFGVNDLNKLPNANKYNELKPEYEKMIKLCHDNNIKVYGAPILPFGTSNYYSEGSEEVRTKINNWMRSAESNLDGIIDFESAVADPANPKNILEKYTHSDGLHPYDGYSAMADAIDLKMFE